MTRGIRRGPTASLYEVRSYALGRDGLLDPPFHVGMFLYHFALDMAKRACQDEAGIPLNVVEVFDVTNERVVRRYWITAEEEYKPGAGRVVVRRVRVFRGSVSRNLRGVS